MIVEARRKRLIPFREPVDRSVEPARNTMKPACASCSFAGHGFVCWSETGPCLKEMYENKKEDSST